MGPEAKSLVFIGLLMASNYPLVGWAASATLTGTVNDIGAADSAHNGISGVWIEVKNLSDKKVGEGLTDAQGAYKIELTISAGTGLTAVYEKLGFQARPTIRKVTDLNKDQKPVPMVKEAASDQYYGTVATRVSDGTLDQIQERVDILVALPETDKSRVTDHLKKAGAVNVFNHFQTAEKRRTIESKVAAELKSDEELNGRPIRVSSDSKVTGSFRLEGAVKSPDEKNRAERIVKSVEGVKKVDNGLIIMK